MSNKFVALSVLLCCYVSQLVSDQPETQASLQWQTNYEQAVQQAKAASKPLLLFFTGSDWCGWCNKLDEEALETSEFASAIGSQLIFVKLDFPLYSSQDPQLKAQNKELQQKFDVRSFPTIIIVDPKQNQQMGITGYRPGGGKAFAEHLLKIINDYSGYQKKMSILDKVPFSGKELKQLYGQAQKLGLNQDIAKITKKGMASNETLFFMKERYKYLAEEGHIHSQEALALKEKLLHADPHNSKKVHYEVAITDFEASIQTMDKEGSSPELAVAPLTEYIEQFGTQDQENVWRLHILISQIYLDKNKIATALKYAQQSYDTAPSSVQPELARAVQNMRSQIHVTP